MTIVGIDTSKRKSTVCILKPYSEVVDPSHEVFHTKQEIGTFISRLQTLDKIGNLLENV